MANVVHVVQGWHLTKWQASEIEDGMCDPELEKKFCSHLITVDEFADHGHILGVVLYEMRRSSTMFDPFHTKEFECYELIKDLGIMFKFKNPPIIAVAKYVPSKLSSLKD